MTKPLTVDWRKVPDWPEYEVSNFGEVRRMPPFFKDSGPLRFCISNGYKRVLLCRVGRRQMASVHRLVYAAFIGEVPEGKVVCHNDSDRGNNVLWNLRVDTPKGNMADAIALGRVARGEECSLNKYSQEFILAVRQRVDAGELVRPLAREVGLPPSTVRAIRDRKMWAWL